MFLKGRCCALVAAATFAAGAASAATVTTYCPGTSLTTDREFTVTTVAPGATCLAAGVGNISGNPATDPLMSILGASYQLIDKTDSGSSILLASGIKALSGAWSFTLPGAPVGYGWGNLVLAFKSGEGQLDPDWAAFLLPSGVTSGSWSIASGRQSLSHANLYGQLVPSAVPLPAAGLLLIAGLGAMGVARRRKA